MEVSVDDIIAFSKCPRYYSFLKNRKPIISPQAKIIQKVLRQVYVKDMVYPKKRPDWRDIVYWTDKYVFKDIDVNNEEQYNHGRKFAENILLFLNRWYTEDYTKSYTETYVNVPMDYIIPPHTIRFIAPFVQLTEVPTLMLTNEQAMDEATIHTNLYGLIGCWFLLKELEVPRIQVKYLTIGQVNAYHNIKLTFNAKRFKNIPALLKDIVYCMAAKIDYPSRTSMCYDCEFKKECYI